MHIGNNRGNNVKMWPSKFVRLWLLSDVTVYLPTAETHKQTRKEHQRQKLKTATEDTSNHDSNRDI